MTSQVKLEKEKTFCGFFGDICSGNHQLLYNKSRYSEIIMWKNPWRQREGETQRQRQRPKEPSCSCPQLFESLQPKCQNLSR